MAFHNKYEVNSVLYADSVIVPRWCSTASMDRSTVRHVAGITTLPEAPYCREGRSLHEIGPGGGFNCRDLLEMDEIGLFQSGRDRFSATQGISAVTTGHYYFEYSCEKEIWERTEVRYGGA
jgi:hypothetical protein